MKKTTYAIIIMIALMMLTGLGITYYSTVTATSFDHYDSESDVEVVEAVADDDSVHVEESSQPAGTAQD